MSDANVDFEIAARLIGHLTNLCASLVMLPVSRSGLWVTVFGISFDKSIKYHRMLGGITYLLVTLHALLWWCKWAAEGNLWANVVEYNRLYISPHRIAYQDFSIPMVELSWFLLTLSLCIAGSARRKMYAVFQYTHKFVGITFYVSAIVHAWCFW